MEIAKQIEYESLTTEFPYQRNFAYKIGTLESIGREQMKQLDINRTSNNFQSQDLILTT